MIGVGLCVRAQLPVGLTKTAVAKAFSAGLSIGSLAHQHQCDVLLIERAIRDVLRRRDGLRPLGKVGGR